MTYTLKGSIWLQFLLSFDKRRSYTKLWPKYSPALLNVSTAGKNGGSIEKKNPPSIKYLTLKGPFVMKI